VHTIVHPQNNANHNYPNKNNHTNHIYHNNRYHPNHTNYIYHNNRYHPYNDPDYSNHYSKYNHSPPSQR